MRRALHHAVVVLLTLVPSQPTGFPHRGTTTHSTSVPPAPATAPIDIRLAADVRTLDSARLPPGDPRTNRSRAGQPHTVRIRGDGQHLVVHGRINDAVSGPMLLDTGSSYCVLTRRTAARLDVRRTGATRVPVATANGNVDAELIQLKSIEVDGARLAGVDALILDAVDPPLIGIIGLSFLNHFRYSVDGTRGIIRLER